LLGIPIYNVNNNCATGSSAIHIANGLVAGGLHDCVLAIGFEKMEKGFYIILLFISSLSMKYTDRTNPLDKVFLKT